MKKKLLLGITVLCLLSCALIFASCGHECTFSDKYGYDEENHWLVCDASAEDGCTEISDTQKHTLVEVFRDKEPDCTKPGEAEMKCKCGYKTTVELAPLGHELEEEIVAPTCDKRGYTIVSCKVSGCRYSERINYTDAAHKWELDDYKEATCEDEGYEKYVCSECGEVEETTFPPAHEFVDILFEPTCDEGGYTEVRCKFCDKLEEIKDEVEPLGHDLVETVIDPTCTSEGYTSVTCTRYGCEYFVAKNEVEKLPHEFEDVVVNATCTEDGYTQKVCIVCDYEGDISNVVPALNHDYQRTPVEATCITGGYTKVTCSRCSYKADEDVEEPLGHTYYKEDDAEEFVHYKISSRPTCDVPGVMNYKCTRCGLISDTETKEIPVLGHIEKETVIPPTCDQQGVTEVSCTRCLAYLRDVEGSVVEALGHDYKMDLGENEIEGVHFEITKKPTCTETGSKAYICQREDCRRVADAAKNPEAIVELPVLGHQWKVVVEPWCGNDGYIESICINTVDGVGCPEYSSVLDESKEYRHSYPADGAAIVDPTCITFGQYICSCQNESGSVCGKEFTAYEGDEVGQPIEHIYEIFIQSIGSTCVDKGYVVYGCSAGECQTTEKRDYAPLVSHSFEEFSELGTTTCVNCGKSFIDITSEEIKENDKVCMGCGEDPCICEGVLGEGTGYIKPGDPIALSKDTENVIDGVELSDGWHDLSIGYGLILLKSDSTATFKVVVYGEDGAEPVEFEETGSYVTIDLYEVPTATKIIITTTEDATVSLFRQF